MGTLESVLITLALLVAPGPGWACTVVEAGPQAIEVFCAKPRTNRILFALVKRDGVVLTVEGRRL